MNTLPVRLRATEVRGLLESTVAIMEPQARAIDVTLALDVSPDVPPTLALDWEKIAWALTALIGNALRFVRPGTRLRPGGVIHVRTRYSTDAAQVTIEVQDDGTGIPADTLPQLLRRSPHPVRGSGLALSLVQDIVAAHGGAVHLESSTAADQSGTIVRVTIPSR